MLVVGLFDDIERLGRNLILVVPIDRVPRIESSGSYSSIPGNIMEL